MTHENAGLWEPSPGWRHRLMRHASHECGWSAVHPSDDVGGYTALCEAHAAACTWPEPPPIVETVSD